MNTPQKLLEQAYEVQVMAGELFVLEQMLKEIKACGSCDWVGDATFTMSIHLTPTNTDTAAKLLGLVERQNALGIGGVDVSCTALE
jgi:hypothetical protein